MRIKFFQKFIDIIRGKRKSFSIIAKENNIQITKKDKKFVLVNIQGINNNIIIENIKTNKGKIVINIFGDNNSVIIKDGFYLSSQLNLIIGQNHPYFGKVINSKFLIDKNTSVESMQYVTFNSNTYCNIGENCMLASNITIFNTDAHPVFNKDTREIINKVNGVEIGRHCWLGTNSTILKNTQIADDCIVGWGSVVSGKHLTPNCAIAGNPAKVVKENITWDSNGARFGYIENVWEVFKNV